MWACGRAPRAAEPACPTAPCGTRQHSRCWAGRLAGLPVVGPSLVVLLLLFLIIIIVILLIVCTGSSMAGRLGAHQTWRGTQRDVNQQLEPTPTGVGACKCKLFQRKPGWQRCHRGARSAGTSGKPLWQLAASSRQRMRTLIAVGALALLGGLLLVILNLQQHRTTLLFRLLRARFMNGHSTIQQGCAGYALGAQPALGAGRQHAQAKAARAQRQLASARTRGAWLATTLLDCASAATHLVVFGLLLHLHTWGPPGGKQ